MKNKGYIYFLLFFLIVYFFSVKHNRFNILKHKQMNSKMIIKSSAFTDGAMIPSKYTCKGIDISPQLSWEDVPHEAKSLAIIMDDPDAPGGTFVHWVIFNIPPDFKALGESFPKQKILPNGIAQGTNDFGRIGYGGPCPPALHRYYFKVYALDTDLKLESGIEKRDLEKAMKGHILGEGQLMGKFQK
jgi:Raf kinase inhibitor-like YbhB/YbcL family protein